MQGVLQGQCCHDARRASRSVLPQCKACFKVSVATMQGMFQGQCCHDARCASRSEVLPGSRLAARAKEVIDLQMQHTATFKLFRRCKMDSCHSGCTRSESIAHDVSADGLHDVSMRGLHKVSVDCMMWACVDCTK
eukprot:1142506-Pelagomonas_calceolata.AAC.1